MVTTEAKNPDFPADDWLDILLRRSLDEDVGAGDVTTEVTIDPASRARGRFVAREAGRVAGLPLLPRIFALLSPDVSVRLLAADGDVVVAGDAVAAIEGPAAPILTGERTALNFLQHLGGIATLTAGYVRETSGTACRVLDTRKTLPGYRALAKYAVRCGGGENHRMGLHDRILMKDNHWAARRVGLAELVIRGRRLHPGMTIEVEVDSLEQLAETLPLQVEWVLLDNFSPEQAAAAVAMRDAVEPDDSGGWRTCLEASGNVTLERVRAFARAGVDAVSVGRLTHSAPALDLGLDLVPAGEDSE